MSLSFFIRKIALSFVLFWVCTPSLFSEEANSNIANSKFDPAVEFNAYYYGDMGRLGNSSFQNNFYVGNMDMELSLNTERAKLWKNGEFYFYIFSKHGDNPSQKVLLDLQGFSNIETSYSTRVLAFYYQHTFEKVKLILGQHDLNSNMARSKFGYNFLNTSFQIQPDISLNSNPSTLTSSGLGVSSVWNVCKNINFSLGIFQGNAGDATTNKYGVSYKIDPKDGIFYITEIEILPQIKNILSLKAGYWQHSANFNISNQETHASSTKISPHGFYSLIDYLILKEAHSTTNGLGVFAKGGWSPHAQNLIHHAYSGGISYRGQIRTKNDFMGLAISKLEVNKSFTGFDPQLNNQETIIEFTYKTQIHENIIIQPDVQYIISPGGTGKTPDSLVSMMRFIAHF